MKDEILKLIIDKIAKIENDPDYNLIVDRIDVVALKEVYNEIIKL